MKSITLCPPNRVAQESYKDHLKVFLAGSIEMDTAEHWQEQIITRYASKPVLFYNPRRSHWDSLLSDTSDEFDEQVNWELDHLDMAHLVILYFDPATKSPISLLELGLLAKSGKMVVCCPDGFWRKGNVRIVCERQSIPLYHSKEELIQNLDVAFSHLKS